MVRQTSAVDQRQAAPFFTFPWLLSPTRCVWQMDAESIMKEKLAAEADLAVARPFLEEANSALDNINAQDIVELKALQKPADIIKLVFDVVMLLMKQPMQRVTPGSLVLGVGRTKNAIDFLADSYALAKVGNPSSSSDVWPWFGLLMAAALPCSAEGLAVGHELPQGIDAVRGSREGQLKRRNHRADCAVPGNRGV